MKSFYSLIALVAFVFGCGLAPFQADAQQNYHIFYQGGEDNDCWDYTFSDPLGHSIQTANPKVGSKSIRMGGSSGINVAGFGTTLTSNQANLAPFNGLFTNYQFSISFRTDELDPNGQGMDSGENLILKINTGSGLTNAARANGGNDHAFNWSSTTIGFNSACQNPGTYSGPCGQQLTGTSCGTCTSITMPNPFTQAVAAGSLFQFQTFIATNAGNPKAFNRTDEFYFIDDAKITGDIAFTPSISIVQNVGATCGDQPTFTATLKKDGAAFGFPAPFYPQWVVNGTNVTGETNLTFAPTNLVNGDIVTCKFILCNEEINPVLSVSNQEIANILSVPVTADAGADASFCGLTGTLAAATPALGTGVWTVIGGNASDITFTNANSPTSGVTSVNLGTYTFQWAVSASGCTASDGVTVTFAPDNLTANAGADQTLCGKTATLAANTPATGATGTWTLQTPAPGTATFVDPNAPNSAVNVSIEGTYTFVWTVSNGSAACDKTDAVTITFSPPISTVDAGPDQSVCGANATLAAVPITGVNGVWTVVGFPTGGSATDVTFANAADPQTVATTTFFGTYVLSWTVSLPGCTASDLVTIVFNPDNLTANAGADAQVCGLTGALSANEPITGAVGTWTLKTPAPGTATFGDANAPTSSVTVSVEGDYTFVWTVSAGAVACDKSDEVTISFLPAVTTPNAGANQTFCNKIFTLTGNAPAATEKGEWSFVTGPVTPGLAPNGQTLTVTAVETGTYTFKYEISNLTGAACTLSDEISVTILAEPDLNLLAQSTVVCAGQPTVVTLSNSESGVIYQVFDPQSGALLGDPFDGNDGDVSVSIPAPVAGQFNYGIKAKIQTANETCEYELVNKFNVTVRPQPVAKIITNAIDNQIIIPTGVITLDGTKSENAYRYLWTITRNDTVFRSDTARSTAYTFKEPGVYKIKLNIEDQPSLCTDETQLSVTVREDESLLIPTVFSPNGDMWNDRFEIKAYNFTDIDVKIYDRWGNLVFSDLNLNAFWEGTNKSNGVCPEGVYVFYVKARRLKTGEFIEHTGLVTLVR